MLGLGLSLSQVSVRALAVAIVVAVPDPALIDEITTFAGKAVETPQSFYDALQAEHLDANTHPPLGPFTHTAVKSGDWHDPATWNTGTVPAGEASVNYGGYTISIRQSCECREVHVGGAGTFSVVATPGAQIVITAQTVMVHGTTWCGDRATPVRFLANGQPGVKFRWKPADVANPTVKGGFIAMGAARMCGEPHAQKVLCTGDMLAGQRTFTVVGVPTANWKVGQEVLVPGTQRLARLTTDPTYKGPNSFWGPDGDVDGPRSNTEYGALGFSDTRSEVRTIESMTATTITFTQALAFDHNFVSRDVWGKTQSIFVPIILRNKPIEHESVDPSARWKRGHYMHMGHADAQYYGVRFRNMGRTDTDPTLADPDGALRYAVDNSTVITDANNVRGRYPFHFHFCGYDMIAVAENCMVDSDRDKDPTPGWSMVGHTSRHAFKDCTADWFRGAAFVTEMGGETGQWTGCIAVTGRGDGQKVNFGTRAENWKNHNGHSGVAFENQSRNILFVDCGHFECTIGWAYLQQDANQIKYEAARTPALTALRLYDPLVWKGETFITYAGERFNETDGYGPEQAQIPPGRDNYSVSSYIGFYVEHRQNFIDRSDGTPMVWHGYSTFNTDRPVAIANYTRKYAWFDGMMVGGDSAFSFGGKSDHMQVTRYRIEDFDAGFVDEGSYINYEGEPIDIQFVNVANPVLPGAGIVQPREPQNNPIDNANLGSYPANGIMGTAWEARPGGATFVRDWTPISSATDIPVAHPAAPYGLGAYDPLPGAPKPYVYIDQAASSLTLDANGGTNQISIVGAVIDHIGARKLGDNQNPETFPNNLSVKAPRHGKNKPPAYYVQQFGCFNDSGTWKTRLWFTDYDRLTSTADAPLLHYSVDVVLLNFDASFLAANARLPDAAKPADAFLAERVRTAAIVRKTTAPAIRCAPAVSVYENQPLFHRLYANEGAAKWAIVGGADAARFEIAAVGGAYGLRWANNGAADFEAPTDGGGNNVYDVQVTAADPLGNVSAPFALSVTVLNVNDDVGPFADDFNRPDENLEASPDWEELAGGAPGALVVRGGVLRNGNTYGIYLARPAGSANRFFQAKVDGYSNLMAAVVDMDGNYDNLIRAVIYADVCQIQGPNNFNAQCNVPYQRFAVIRLEMTPGQVVVKQNGAVMGALAIPLYPDSPQRTGFTIAGSNGGDSGWSEFNCGPL